MTEDVGIKETNTSFNIFVMMEGTVIFCYVPLEVYPRGGWDKPIFA